MNSRLPDQYNAHKLLDEGIEFCCLGDEDLEYPKTAEARYEFNWELYYHQQWELNNFEDSIQEQMIPNTFKIRKSSLYFMVKNNTVIFRIWGVWGIVDEDVRTLKGDYIIKRN